MNRSGGQSADRTHGILYYNHGQKCLARLVVSCYTLRQHYGGPVTVLDTGESGGLLDRIAADERLGLEVRRVPFEVLRRHSCYVAKAGLWEHSPYGTTILLDSDTVVARDPAGLWGAVEAPGSGGVVVTQFSDWVTTGQMIRGRIEKWRGVVVPGQHGNEHDQIRADELVERCLAWSWPALNTGLIGWSQEGLGFLRDWKRLTRAGWRCPFTDELAAQLLARRYRHTVLGDEWNCSPIYGQNRHKAVIWHLHGSKHVAREGGRGQQGHAIWWPAFLACWRENVGHVRDWAPAGDEHLGPHLVGLASATA